MPHLTPTAGFRGGGFLGTRRAPLQLCGNSSAITSRSQAGSFASHPFGMVCLSRVSEWLTRPGVESVSGQSHLTEPHAPLVGKHDLCRCG